jgi:diguanylate cyclase (GGDEF)-like protein
LKIAFYLVSILPFLVCVYLVSRHIVPRIGLKTDIVLTLVISILISLAGFLVIKEVFDRVLSLSKKAHRIAEGDITTRLEVSSADEVGELSLVLNKLTQRIRSNMEELKTYGERTTQINLDIQKRMLVLSNLLQINALISKGAPLEETLRLATDKMRLVANSDTAYLFLLDEEKEVFRIKAVDGLNAELFIQMQISPQDYIFKDLLSKNKPLILDRANILPAHLADELRNMSGLRNILAMAVSLKGKTAAILGIGNSRQDFAYSKDDSEILDIFSKQIAIAIENDLLLHRLEKLEIRDALTGLYNEGFIRPRLKEEIGRAIRYHRPCAFILLNVDNFREFQRSFGLLQAEAGLKKIGRLIADAVTEVDRVGRVGDNEFAVILPERNKRQAQQIAEEMRKNIAYSFNEEPDLNKRFTISAGVSENPLDGVEAEDLVVKARESLKSAKSQGKNRVV